MISLGFDNSYRRLPDRFHARVAPTAVAAPRLLAFNRPLAEELGLDIEAVEPLAASLFSGNVLAADSEPVALAYAAHQFGQFVPQLGDGRAVLLGERVDRFGRRRDIQLKGSGPTPFSRRGDGRATLSSVLREYLISEAMHALGIPSTRALAAVATGETVRREAAFPGAVLTRVAASHLRIGTFQFFAARRDDEALRLLVEHAIARHYPELAQADRPALSLLDAVISRQASLVARWMHVGFIHGVMNTDNMTISGETIDYGPCAFMDAYDPAKVFSSIDQGGRYAFANQPAIAQWNLARLAETLLPMMDDDTDRAVAAAVEVLDAFPGRFETAWIEGMRHKLGLIREEAEDRELVRDLLELMQASAADFTQVFRGLCGALQSPQAHAAVGALFKAGDGPRQFDAWASRWQARVALEAQAAAAVADRMRSINPAVIPRNHRVEEALAAANGGDLGPFDALLKVVQRPFEEHEAMARYQSPPAPTEQVYQTFCGT